MKRACYSVLVLAAAGLVGIGLPWAVAQVASEPQPQAEDGHEVKPPAIQPDRPVQEDESSDTVNYLGVLVTEVPDMLAAHFPEALAEGRGVLIAEVTPESPAAQAGLAPFDVVLAFNGGEIATPDELVAAVRDAEPESEVTLEVLHAGQQRELTVTLGRRAASELLFPDGGGPPGFGFAPRFPPGFPRFQRPRLFIQPGGEFFSGGAPGSVQGLALQSLGDGRYRAEVFYNVPGAAEAERRSFEGTLDEIREQMRDELPEDVSESMLQQLDAQQRMLESGPGFGAFGGEFGFGAPLDPNEMFERFLEGLPPEIRERFEQPFRMPRRERERPREDLPVA